jgi:N-acetyl-gamma-glutamyl-phosphate reductase
MTLYVYSCRSTILGVSAIIKASIIGATGYSGVELLKILLRHPGVEIDRLCAGSTAGERFEDVHPRFSGEVSARIEPYSAGVLSASDIVFVALPSGEAMRIMPELLGRGKRVIDLGGDFRLDTAQYERYYEREHTAPTLLSQAVYGLPEWNREAIRQARLIANPGCYPTSAILPLAPLLERELIDSANISITSMSGVSGAGRNASLSFSFCEVNDSVKAYRVASHQHLPEIRSVLRNVSGKGISFTFTPHLIPITRGIYTTTTATLADDATADAVADAFAAAYAGEPFVRCSTSAVPEIRHVTHTNYIDIGWRLAVEENRIVLISAIDNLIKGAAGQAVQNMNIMLGFEETEGLL